ncbi:Dynein heavy chain 5, axonemal [Liparis tanakae]|uniref:Dynein heavy chain 5, axonemal n=1 Tax=Liparis tanakae TaxID=230148 RepID=A0A4Z2E9P9_9TELE|nr:Dynein heavy chain 5, axonemal [Liparis tanakae]
MRPFVGRVSKAASDLLECRIGRLLRRTASCRLLPLPEDRPAPPHDLLLQARGAVPAAAAALSWQSQQVEKYVFELIEELKRKMKTTETVNLEGSFLCLHPDSKQKTRCLSCPPCLFYNLIGQLCHRNTEALVKATRSSLDALRRRLLVLKHQPSSAPPPPPLFRASIQLSIPNIVLRPSLEDMQV